MRVPSKYQQIVVLPTYSVVEKWPQWNIELGIIFQIIDLVYAWIAIVIMSIAFERQPEACSSTGVCFENKDKSISIKLQCIIICIVKIQCF